MGSGGRVLTVGESVVVGESVGESVDSGGRIGGRIG